MPTGGVDCTEESLRKRENLHDLTAQLLGLADLRRAAAAGAVGNFAAVAQPRDFGIERRAHDEACAVSDIEAGGRRVHDRAHTQDHARVGTGEVPGDLEESVRGKVAAVGELDAPGAPVGASLDHPGTDLSVWVREDGDNPLFDHRAEYRQAVFQHSTLPFGGRGAGKPFPAPQALWPRHVALARRILPMTLDL